MEEAHLRRNKKNFHLYKKRSSQCQLLNSLTSSWGFSGISSSFAVGSRCPGFMFARGIKHS